MKLPTIELKIYSKDIVRNILKTTLKEFEKEYNGRFDKDITFDPSKIKFIVE